MSDYPWFAFYPADYIRKVGNLPLATQGLWMWMLCAMDKSPRRGVLLKGGGEPYRETDLPVLVNDTPGTIHRSLEQLKEYDILAIEEETGAMYSRRMVRDEAKRVYEREKKRNQRAGGRNVPGNVPALSPNGSPPLSGKPPSTYVSMSPEGESEGEPTGPSVMAFWHAYPERMRTGQGEVIAEWSQAIAEGADPQAIVDAAVEFAASPKGKSKFCPKPAKWIKDRCWLDSREAWQRSDDDKPKEKVYVPR